MQISPHVYSVHIDDDSFFHPGGSNIFFVGNVSSGMFMIDAGENDDKWINAILNGYASLGQPAINGVLITHGHNDHVGGLKRILSEIEAPVFCHPKLVNRLEKLLGSKVVHPILDNQSIAITEDVNLLSIFTPGHDETHVCYYVNAEEIMFTGDTVLGSSSSTVQDMSAYMDSMHRLSTHRVSTICPAHGAVCFPPEGEQLISKYIDNRLHRERAIISAIGRGINTVELIVQEIYSPQLNKGLRAAASRNIVAHLEKLIKEKVVRKNPINSSYVTVS